jgi:biotin synthase-like enzyme
VKIGVNGFGLAHHGVCGSIVVSALTSQPPVDVFHLVRLIAVTRMALPKARVRLAAGRTRISREGQALCFFAGANSIFYGDKLLTAKNPHVDVDVALLRELGLHVESNATTTRTADFPARLRRNRRRNRR